MKHRGEPDPVEAREVAPPVVPDVFREVFSAPLSSAPPPVPVPPPATPTAGPSVPPSVRPAVDGSDPFAVRPLQERVEPDVDDSVEAGPLGPLWLRPGEAHRVSAAAFAVLALLGLVGLAGGAVVRGWLGAAIVVVGCLLLVPFVLVATVFPSALVDGGELRVRSGRTTRRVVPLADVAAVGLVHDAGSRPHGWVPWLWLEDGEPVALPAGRFLGWDMVGGASRVPLWEALAETPQGLACLAVLARVREAQVGAVPVGRDQEVVRRGTGRRELAYWSADRTIGVHLLPVWPGPGEEESEPVSDQA